MSKKDQYPSDAADRFQVRFPPGMREQVARWANLNGRSMNTEIVSRLNATFRAEIRGNEVAFATMVANIISERLSQEIRELASSIEANYKKQLQEMHDQIAATTNQSKKP